jgi:catechol 2,3-dioxygenase-like lactoylglutathione lyase family enzyme
MNGPALSSILLYSKNIDNAVEFYRTILQRDPLFQGDEVTIFDCGSIELIIHKDPAPFVGLLEGLETEEIRGKGVIIGFRVENVDLQYNRLLHEGVVFSTPPISQPFGRRQAYLYDLDGYNVVLESRVD